jgi:copper chaperone NosL
MIKINTKFLLPITFIFIVLSFSCKREMRAISYGKDNCEQCRMTIIDTQFGSGMLTSKGRVLTFDSGECLFRYLKAKGLNENEQYFVTDYSNPGTLINAAESSFLHSENIQSPMGGNLAAFKTQESATTAQKQFGGELLEWSKLISKK